MATLTITVLLVQIVMGVKAQDLFSTYIATPEASGGGILGRSNALGCGRVCSQDTTCRGYFVADNSSDSCVIFTDTNVGGDAPGIGIFYWKVPPTETPRTCTEIAIQLRTGVLYGQYQIDPDGPGGLDPITVTCHSQSGAAAGAVTYADHDRLSTEKVSGSNDDWEVEYGYRHTITYNDSITQLRALATLSNACRMKVEIRCYEVLFEDVNGNHLAGWVAYDGRVFPMTEGGDVCPLDSSLNTRKCNCNNDAVWYTESGYITDTDSFPIQALAFGDMGPGQETLEIKVGQLECAGAAGCGAPPEITFATKDVEGHAVGDVLNYHCFPGLVFDDGFGWMMIMCMPGGFWDTPLYTKCGLGVSNINEGMGEREVMDEIPVKG